MTIDQAIKQLQDALADKWCPWSPELKQSINLGLEALKRCKEQRSGTALDEYDFLPGETKDSQEHHATVSETSHSPLTWGRAWAEARASLNK